MASRFFGSCNDYLISGYCGGVIPPWEAPVPLPRGEEIVYSLSNTGKPGVSRIDIDCVDSDRPRIFRHIIEKFGEIHTARVASYGTLADLATIDVAGGALRKIYEERFPDSLSNPWSLDEVDKVKEVFASDPERAKERWPELFQYFDGLNGTTISQSVHPAGMVIAPVNLDEDYGVFHKDGERCLLLDMDAVHDIGLAKYDLLILRTVEEIRDVCALIGERYPRTYEINWNDEAVWEDMRTSPVGIFQMESHFAFDSLKKFRPNSIEEMSLVTACIRPSGASYRDELLARKPHHNPSKMIDDLLKDNNGYLIYQCDVIKFLQQICGFSGGDADSVRRLIARKHPEELAEVIPRIVDGYCASSDKPREEAEAEAKEFVQIIQDASSYMFG